MVLLAQIGRNDGAKYTWFSESIELRGISSEGLKHIVEFMYTGKLPISMQSVQNILAVARHMQVKLCPLLLATSRPISDTLGDLERFQPKTQNEKILFGKIFTTSGVFFEKVSPDTAPASLCHYLSAIK